MGDNQPMSTDHEDANFSRLEASFSRTKVLPRRNSIEMKDIFRHAQASDLEAKDLDFNFSLDRSNYPLGNLQSLQDVFPAVQHDTHLKNPANFSDETDIMCLDVNENTSWAPLSVYLRYDAALRLTSYIISHKEGDSNIQALQNIFNLAIKTAPAEQGTRILLDDPFDLAVILSTLNFEASKYHAQRFRRYMWTQINKVDDHLAGLETNDRRKLGELTKELQIISQNADSHLGNADVAIITATGIRTAHARLHEAMGSPARVFERASDSITYVIESMQKQKIWFLNYKNRKDSTMALVYNLVTQQDAASNIQLAASMKRDSTSMNAIAALTMVFLPGTFIATILDIGSFNGSGDNKGSESTSVWWLWAAITVPLTLVVMTSWWLYKKRNDKVRPAPMPKEEEDRIPSTKRGTFRSMSFSSWSRRDSAAAKV
ncbi:hypothetical protein KXW88_009577 [Aspergillus fumigatus]|nr:hypothetical protein KXW88_009577 [Aspergillus fumigatus]